MRPDDDDFWPEEPKIYSTHYCTPLEVAMTLDLPDPDNPLGFYKFSDMSQPSEDTIRMWIASNEDRIDLRLRRSWRVNYVKDFVTDIPQYMWDEVSFRSAYYANGGNYIQLRKNILPWDPQKGDRIELRSVLNNWGDQSIMRDEKERLPPELGPDNFWFDYRKGRLFLRMRKLQPKFNALRISYRYGSEEEVPAGIKRLCCLLTAIQVLQSQAFLIKVGLGGDISGIKADMVKSFQDEANELYSAFQRSGSVHGVPQR